MRTGKGRAAGALLELGDVLGAVTIRGVPAGDGTFVGAEFFGAENGVGVRVGGEGFGGEVIDPGGAERTGLYCGNG